MNRGSSHLSVNLDSLGIHRIHQDQTGGLGPWDFLLTDINNNNPRTIDSVTHSPGDSTATITMSEPLTSGDSLSDLLATLGISVWDADGDPSADWEIAFDERGGLDGLDD